MAGANDGRQIQQPGVGAGLTYNADGSGVADDYRKPSLPQSSFPPRSGGTGPDLMVHPDRLMQVATAMGNDLARLRAALQRLYSEGSGGALLDGWSTAADFGGNAANAYTGISQVMNDLINACEATVGNIHTTVRVYADANAAVLDEIHRVGPEPSP